MSKPCYAIGWSALSNRWRVWPWERQTCVARSGDWVSTVRERQANWKLSIFSKLEESLLNNHADLICLWHMPCHEVPGRRVGRSDILIPQRCSRARQPTLAGRLVVEISLWDKCLHNAGKASLVVASDARGFLISICSGG